MSIQFSGVLSAAAADRSHNDLAPLTDLPFKAGMSNQFSLGVIANGGNVAQTATASIVNCVHCTPEKLEFVADDGTITANAITLHPGATIRMVVFVKADDRAIGDPNEEASFAVDTIWS